MGVWEVYVCNTGVVDMCVIQVCGVLRYMYDMGGVWYVCVKVTVFLSYDK